MINVCYRLCSLFLLFSLARARRTNEMAIGEGVRSPRVLTSSHLFQFWRKKGNHCSVVILRDRVNEGKIVRVVWISWFLFSIIFSSGDRTSVESGRTSIRNASVRRQTCSCQQTWHSYNKQSTQRECGAFNRSCGGMGEAWRVYLSKGKHAFYSVVRRYILG